MSADYVDDSTMIMYKSLLISTRRSGERDRKNNKITIGSFNIHDLPEKRRNKQKEMKSETANRNFGVDAENTMNRLIMPSAKCSVCCFRESTPFPIPLHIRSEIFFGSLFSSFSKLTRNCIMSAMLFFRVNVDALARFVEGKISTSKKCI